MAQQLTTNMERGAETAFLVAAPRPCDVLAKALSRAYPCRVEPTGMFTNLLMALDTIEPVSFGAPQKGISDDPD
ncbi:hypothetical protein [Sphingomonas echinoides]|uniref:hypothetical protein n=1 Tax=Sphingomonas echinoides TaxID=59803 RepID=UPI002413B84C|nr:hypothetical protein [Sphingomonas echinoides]